MKSNIVALLREYGLDDKEIRVYIYLVGKLELTAYKISKETNIHRSTTYDILERLCKKGFVSRLEKSEKAYYSANDLSKILSSLKDRESLLVSLIPEFEKLQKVTETRVRSFEDIEGQKQFNYSLFILAKEKKLDYFYIIGNTPAYTVGTEALINKLLQEYKTKKIHKFITCKAIWDYRFKKDKTIKKFEKIGKNRFLHKLPSKATTLIYGNRIAFISFPGKPNIIEIKDELIAEEMRHYFLYLWNLSEK